MRGLPPLLVALVASLRAAAGFVFSVKPGGLECFHERAGASDHVQGEWAVVKRGGSGPNFHDDSHALLKSGAWSVVVSSPSDDKVYTSPSLEDQFNFYATVEGQYTICFSLNDDEEHKFGSLSVSAQFTVGDPPDLIQLAKTEHLSPIEERIKNLHESMNAVRDLQDEIRDQDEAQSKMTRSTRSWLLYFTLIEATVLVGVTVWQNLYLKSFFEVKRVV